MYTEIKSIFRSFYEGLVSEAVIVKMASHFFYRFLWEDSPPFKVVRSNQKLILEIFSRNMGIVTVRVRTYSSGLHMSNSLSASSLIVTEGGCYQLTW